MKKKKTSLKKSDKNLDKRKDSRDRERLNNNFYLEKLVKDQNKQIRIKNGQLRNGIKKQKKAEKQISRDVKTIRNRDLEIIKQREELLHVTRVGKLAEFVSSLAHEISQPLTAILSYAQAAQRILAGKNPQLHEVLEHIINDDKRASNVIQRMRTLLKKSEPEMNPLDIKNLIGETIALVSTDTTVRNITIKTDFDTDLPPVLGDKVQIQQVILNIISNSFEALENAKGLREISVRTSRKNERNIMVEIKDSGCGISKKDLPRLFTHFFTSKPDGLGMGLSISRSIVEKHGGKLIAKNNTGRGATLYFTIPVYEEEN